MLTVACKSCSEQFMVSDDVIGTQVTCPACARPVLVERPMDDEDLGPIADGAWEYTMLVDHGRMGHVDENKLNRLGRQGWELVAVFKESVDANTNYYFKRPLKKE
jgi:hypothetical protein